MVTINENGTRVPLYSVYGLDSSYDQTDYLNFTITDGYVVGCRAAQWDVGRITNFRFYRRGTRTNAQFGRAEAANGEAHPLKGTALKILCVSDRFLFPHADSWEKIARKASGKSTPHTLRLEGQ